MPALARVDGQGLSLSRIQRTGKLQVQAWSLRQVDLPAWIHFLKCEGGRGFMEGGLTYIHKSIHTYIHTDTHAHIHTHIHTHALTR